MWCFNKKTNLTDQLQIQRIAKPIVPEMSELDAVCKRIDRAVRSISENNTVILSTGPYNAQHSIVCYDARTMHRTKMNEKAVGSKRLLYNDSGSLCIPITFITQPSLICDVQLTGIGMGRLSVIGKYLSCGLDVKAVDNSFSVPCSVVSCLKFYELRHYLYCKFMEKCFQLPWTYAEADAVLVRNTEAPSGLFQLIMNATNHPKRIFELLKTRLKVECKMDEHGALSIA